MPHRPLRPCAHAGCPELVDRGYCLKHRHKQAALKRRPRDTRPTAAARGYDAAWQRLRQAYSAEHPECEMCGRGRKSRDPVDHIRPVSTHPELRLVSDNLIALCWSCHEKKHPRGARARWGRAGRISGRAYP